MNEKYKYSEIGYRKVKEDKLSLAYMFYSRDKALRWIRREIWKIIESTPLAYDVEIKKVRKGRKIEEVIVILELKNVERRIIHFRIREA